MSDLFSFSVGHNCCFQQIFVSFQELGRGMWLQNRDKRWYVRPPQELDLGGFNHLDKVYHVPICPGPRQKRMQKLSQGLSQYSIWVTHDCFRYMLLEGSVETNAGFKMKQRISSLLSYCSGAKRPSWDNAEVVKLCVVVHSWHITASTLRFSSPHSCYYRGM